MALTYSSLGGGTTGFAIDTGDGTKTDVTLSKEYPAGGYQISSANGNQGLFIFFGASDGTPAGGTSSKSIVATKAFNKLTIIGVTANDLITFTYKETATLNAVGTSSSYSGAVVTSFTPNQISAVNDTLILNGAALGTSVTVKFTGANGTPLDAKSITRVSDTQLIVTRPDTMPGDQDPYKITVQNPGIEPAVSTSTATQPLYAGSAPTWSTAATLPAFTKSVSYTQQLLASDPDGTAITYSFVSGSLPAGLTYAANSSTISGTPTGSTSATFTIRATETSGRYTDRTFTLPDAYPVFTTGATLTPYIKNTAYSATIVATDDSGVAPALSVVGTMPNGLSFNALTGAVSGTPTTSTNQTFTIRATDANGSTTDQTFTIPNTGPTWVTSTTLPVYTKNVVYSTTLVATDDGTITYTLVSGSLPTGLSLNNSTGVISGTPTVTTNHSPVIRVQDDAGNYVNRTFTLNNVGANVPVWTTSGTITQATNGLAYSYQLVATDDSGIAPVYTLETGSLVSGLSLSSSGLISGTPTAAGTSNITVRATDTNGGYAVSSTISLTVAQTISAAISTFYATTDYTLASGNITVFDFRTGYANGNKIIRTYAKGGNGGTSSARGGYGAFLQGDLSESQFVGKVVALVSAGNGADGNGARGSGGGGGYSGWIQIDPSDINNKKCLTHIFTAAGGGGAAGPGDASNTKTGGDTGSIVYSGTATAGTAGTAKSSTGSTGTYPGINYSARFGNAYGGGDGCSNENGTDNFPPGSSGGFGPLAGGAPDNASGPGILGGNPSAGGYGTGVNAGGFGGGGAATNGGSGGVVWRVCSGGGGGGGFYGGNGGTYSGDQVPSAGTAGTSFAYSSGVVTTHTPASSASPYARVQIV